MILGFRSDGGAAGNVAVGSPVLAHGYQSPTGLVWDVTLNQLWVSGSDPQAPSSIARVPLGGQVSDWPIPLQFDAALKSSAPVRVAALEIETHMASHQTARPVLLDASSQRTLRLGSSGLRAPAIRLDGRDVLAVAVGSPRVVYAAVRGESTGPAAVFQLLRIRYR
jgi:hypothetical protein